MIDYMEEDQLLSIQQHGYRHGKSTTTCLLQSLHDWTHWIDSGHDVDVIDIDFLKAFDRTPHHLLITKLSHYRFHIYIILWIENFLKSRSQSIRHKGILSSPKPIPSGIVQESNISAVLFRPISYINDIVSVVRNAKVSISVDDLEFSHKINSVQVNHLLQEDKNAITQWSFHQHIENS